jgi:hypothetical protein
MGADVRDAEWSSRRRMPPEYCIAGRFAASVSEKRSSISSARRRASLRDRSSSRPIM